MQPTLSSVHVNRVLTNISIAYMQSQMNFVATKVFPVIPVEKKSDVYFIYNKNDWFRDEMQRRAPGTESAGSGYGVGTDNYNCDVWSLHKDIDKQTLANADVPLNLEREASKFLTMRRLLRQEIQWVSDYFAVSKWTTDVVGGTDFTVWSDYATSNPKADIKTGKRTVLATTGFLPNTLVLGYDVFDKLSDHPDFVDRVKYTTSDNVTAELLARMLEVDRVLVAQAVKATNIEGETATYDFTHGKHALLAYVAPDPGLLTPSAGYTFEWTGVSDGMGDTVGVSDFEIPAIKSVRYEIEAAWDNKVVAQDLGYFFSGAVL